MYKRIRNFLLLILALLLAYLLFWPIPVKPEKWVPPPAPSFEGVFKVNNTLDNLKLSSTKPYHGPEDVAIDSSLNIYAGVEEGRILKWMPQDRVPVVFAETGGRPLGLHFDFSGNLIVADAMKGLLAVSQEGETTVLATEANGVPFAFTDDLEVAQDGKIYFSDASWKWGFKDYVYDIMEQKPFGRLLVYDPKTRTTSILLEGLYFANGIAVSKNDEFVLVNETGRYRITRFWLKGPKKGRHDVFIDNLPGFPDGISSNGAGLFWLAIPSPRKAVVDKLHSRPYWKRVFLRFPKSLQPKPERYGFVVGLDENANVVYNLQDPEGRFSQVTSVQQFGDTLYLGSLVEPAFAKLPVPKLESSKN